MSAQKAFEAYCKRNRIISGQYIEEIQPIWESAYRSALATQFVNDTSPEVIRRVLNYRDKTQCTLLEAKKAVDKNLDKKPTLEEFIERIYTTGWRSHGDAQHEHITAYYKELFE